MKTVKKLKAWAILTKRNQFSHVVFEKETAETWEGYKVVPALITYQT